METISIDRTITVVSLMISIIALWHTYAVNKSFAKNQLIIDQVKAVNKLVNYLNKKKIELKFTTVSDDGNARAARSGEVTIFELVDIGDKFEDFDNVQIVLDSNRCNEVFEFLNFLNDPLIPSVIAKELSKFMNGHNFVLKAHSDFAGSGMVIIESGVRYAYELLQYRSDELRNKLISGNAVALKSWLSFKMSAESLRNEIHRWLKSKDIKDLNIRTEFQAY